MFQNQILPILRADQNYITQHGINFSRDEEQIMQPVYFSRYHQAHLFCLIVDPVNKHRVSWVYNLNL